MSSINKYLPSSIALERLRDLYVISNLCDINTAGISPPLGNPDIN
jgi:hypothetical protein